MRVSIAVLCLAGCFEKGEFLCTGDEECVRDGVLGRCELVGYCSFQDIDCETGRRFADLSGELSSQCIAIASACVLPDGALLAWQLDIPIDSAYSSQADVQYAEDRRDALAGTSFRRVAYCLQLDDRFVYTEFDDFTGGVVQDTGIPTDNAFDVTIANLTIRTNVETLTEVANAAGKLEFWPNCYGPGPGGAYDTDDEVSGEPGLEDCYGSFQVHGQTTTALSFNHWAASPENDDVGIGNQPDGEPDWTFAQTTQGFTTRVLQAFVLP